MTVGEENEQHVDSQEPMLVRAAADAPHAWEAAPAPVAAESAGQDADTTTAAEPSASDAAGATPPVPERTQETPSARARPAAAPAEPAAPRAAKPPPMKWYVVQVYSGYEQKVKASLAERVKQAGIESLFGDVLIPTETVQDVQGRRKPAARTFYPGYIFVQMSLSDEVWHVVRDTPKVTGFVGGRTPQPVPSPEIQSVVQQVEEGAAKPRPRVIFATGDHVRINAGAFANFTGTVEQVNPDKHKVRVLVSIFGRATPVELDYTQVEKTA